MNTVTVNYRQEPLTVTKEVADFLEVSRKQMAASDRKYREHNLPSGFIDPDSVPNARRCIDRDYLVNKVIRTLESEAVWNRIHLLPLEQQELYRLRYTEDLTLQEIANRLGVSKMAICKRLQKLHDWARFVLAA